ncbi:MAG: signal peptidase I [Candidatus Omnitrophica bacterium]|nr:signal peptidase I [Candidatus Omnitrophota bacterium]
MEDIQFFRREPKKWLYDKWKEWGEPLVIAIILAVAIRTFLIGPYKIPTGSMEPTLMVGDRIFVDKLTYRFHPPKRGEIVVFKYPLDPKKDFVKRLIAFGGEEVEIRDGSIYVNGAKLEEPNGIRNVYYYNRNDWQYGKEGEKFTIPPKSFFVLGDNSGHSSDSRNWGFVPEKDMIGRAVVIWWPPKRVGWAH